MREMKCSFAAGDIVRLAPDSQGNYGSLGATPMRVTHVATGYMHSAEFFAKGKPQGFHPGFDDCGFALYDLETLDGKPVPVSLYDWELEGVRRRDMTLTDWLAEENKELRIELAKVYELLEETRQDVMDWKRRALEAGHERD